MSNLSTRMRNSLKAMERRLDYLTDKLRTFGGKSGQGGYLEAELAATRWAVELMKKEIEKGIT